MGEKINVEFTGEEFDFIMRYMKESEAVSVQVAILNAISVALDDEGAEEKWISVQDQLPFAEYGESNNVLAACRMRDQISTDEYRFVKTLYFNGGNWCYPTGETFEEQVIAWMPIPDPYKFL